MFAVYLFIFKSRAKVSIFFYTAKYFACFFRNHSHKE